MGKIMQTTLATRFWQKVEKTSDCWIWTASRTPHGYGQIAIAHATPTYAHRVAYELLRGPIPDGLTLDHLCRNPACVNPDHLEPVSQKINVLRGKSPMAINAVKTHCPKDHPYAGTNLGIRPNGHRYCRTCARERMRKKSVYA